MHLNRSSLRKMNACALFVQSHGLLLLLLLKGPAALDGVTKGSCIMHNKQIAHNTNDVMIYSCAKENQLTGRDQLFTQNHKLFSPSQSVSSNQENKHIKCLFFLFRIFYY